MTPLQYRIFVSSLMILCAATGLVAGVNIGKYHAEQDPFLCGDFCNERFEHYLQNGTVPDGFFSANQSDQYFCVRTNDRDYDQIMATVTHEMAHLYVFREEGHFCEGEPQ